MKVILILPTPREICAAVGDDKAAEMKDMLRWGRSIAGDVEMTSELSSLFVCVVGLLHANYSAGFRTKKFDAVPKRLVYQGYTVFCSISRKSLSA
jgi:hypothetical protein